MTADTTNALATIERMTKHFRGLGVIGKDARMGILSAVTMPSDAEFTANERRLTVTISTPDIDMDDEIVDPDGIDDSYLMAPGQRKVFADHRYELEYTLGSIRWTKAYPERGKKRGITAMVNIFTGLRSPYADDTWQIAQQAGVGASIGFAPIEVSRYRNGDPVAWKNAKSIVRRCKVVELSLTCMPCNVSCQSQAVTYDTGYPEKVKTLLVDGGPMATAKVLGYTDRVPRLILVRG